MGTKRGKGVGDPRHGAADGREHSSELPGGNGSLQGNSDLRNVPLVGHSLAQNL